MAKTKSATRAVNVLGTTYVIHFKDYNDDPSFADESIDGYCDAITHEIVVCNMKTWPGMENSSTDRREAKERETLRHEIVHAFLNGSGLRYSSLMYKEGWATNEEMVDWFAMQGPKIFVAWLAVGALEVKVDGSESYTVPLTQ